MFDYKLAAEIYKAEPWLMDAVSFASLFNILTDLRSGVKIDYDPKFKLNNYGFIEVASSTKIIFDPFQLRNVDDDAEVISIINLDGPITKNGGMSSVGMKELSSRMNKMTNDKRVKGHILVTDSGGGSSNAVVFMTDAVKRSQSLGKPVVQFIEKGGLSASAAYHIGSGTDFIISESADNLVGSIGTMIEFAGFPKEHVRNSDGAVFVRAYATASVNKNKEFEEALKGNLQPVISNILDPVNEKFMAQVQENRPGLITEEQLTGVVVSSDKAIGSLIDSLGTFDDAVSKVLELSESGEIKNFVPPVEGPTNKLITKNDKMDLSKLKSEHRDVYQAAFNEGVVNEKDRVGAWMAHSSTDIEAVKQGIDSGENISATKREEFLVKLSSKKHVENIADDSAEEVLTDESETGSTSEQDEVNSFYAGIDKKLGIKK